MRAEFDGSEQNPARYTVAAPDLGALVMKWGAASVEALTNLPENFDFESLYPQDAGEVDILNPDPNLQVPLVDLLTPEALIPTKLETTTCNALIQNGPLQTVRDLLIWGKDGIDSIYGIKKGAIDLLGSRLAKLDPALEWKKRPGVLDWIELCATVDDIPVGNGLRLSIGEALALSDEQLAGHFYLRDRYPSFYAGGKTTHEPQVTETHRRFARSLRERLVQTSNEFSKAQTAYRLRLAQRPKDSDV